MVYVVMSKVNNKRVFYYVKFLWKVFKVFKEIRWDYVILNKYEVCNLLDFK